jgi:hypothetical protein
MIVHPIGAICGVETINLRILVKSLSEEKIASYKSSSPMLWHEVLHLVFELDKIESLWLWL